MAISVSSYYDSDLCFWHFSSQTYHKREIAYSDRFTSFS
mgnify:CR=1 FL=1